MTSRACYSAEMTCSHGLGRPAGIKAQGHPAPTDDAVFWIGVRVPTTGADGGSGGGLPASLSQPKKRQDEEDDDDQADEINDAVHGGSSGMGQMTESCQLGDSKPPVSTLLVSAQALCTLAHTGMHHVRHGADLCRSITRSSPKRVTLAAAILCPGFLCASEQTTAAFSPYHGTQSDMARKTVSGDAAQRSSCCLNQGLGPSIGVPA
jgi:hypothetical protein